MNINEFPDNLWSVIYNLVGTIFLCLAVVCSTVRMSDTTSSVCQESNHRWAWNDNLALCMERTKKTLSLGFTVLHSIPKKLRSISPRSWKFHVFQFHTKNTTMKRGFKKSSDSKLLRLDILYFMESRSTLHTVLFLFSWS